MSRRSRKKSKPSSRKPPSQRKAKPLVDVKALDAVARPVGFATLHGLQWPFLEPLEEPEDHRTFDRIVCEAGIKAYIRPMFHSDKPGAIPGLDDDGHFSVWTTAAEPGTEPDEPTFVGTHVLVREMKPNVRSRVAVTCYPAHEMN